MLFRSEKIRNFLIKIKDEDDINILYEKIVSFMSVINAPLKRKNTFQKIIDTLSPKKIKMLILPVNTFT